MIGSWLNSMSIDARTALWTILVSSLCGLLCAWVGVWLVLQRMSLLGDAISHAVLPGLAIAFLMFGTRAAGPMLLGGAAAALVTVWATQGMSRYLRVREDAGLGVAFSAMFAIGVIVITRFARQIDLDPGCVLYGLVEFVALDTVPMFGVPVPAALGTILPALVCVGVLLLLLSKEIGLAAFDPRLAGSLGLRPQWVHALLMAAAALATVASFEAVGSILVIAMLIVPAATAQLLTKRLRPMFAWASVLAVAAAAMGYWAAATWNTSVSGMIACVLGGFYAIAAIGRFWMARWVRSRLQAQARPAA